MARWKPNAPERLERAALELFTEHGYDSATVAQIAQRAGLTSSTFFRYFTDKREVLFWRQEALGRMFADAIAAAPPASSALQMLAGALEAVGAGVFSEDQHELNLRRHAVLATSTELQERQLLKRATTAATMASSFRDRGIDEPAATVVAELGSLAFSTAYARWVDPGNREEFTELARQVLEELTAAATTLH